MIWTDNQIATLAQEGETDVCNKMNLIYKRVSLSTTPGQQDYMLPEDVDDIDMVTYRGFVVTPNDITEMVNSRTTPRTVTAGSRPLFYITKGFGQDVIRLTPPPNETLAVQSGDLFNTTAISAGLIISYWASPDFTSTQDRIPDYFRRPLVKMYVLYRALQQNGPGQYLQGSDQFKGYYDLFFKLLKKFNFCTYLSRENISAGDSNTDFRLKPARPILPPNYPRNY
jgi:hypothetical protein